MLDPGDHQDHKDQRAQPGLPELTENPVQLDLKVSQEPKETLELKERKVTGVTANQDPGDHPGLQDLQDHHPAQTVLPLWIWRDLDLVIWRAYGDCLACRAHLAHPAHLDLPTQQCPVLPAPSVLPVHLGRTELLEVQGFLDHRVLTANRASLAREERRVMLVSSAYPVQWEKRVLRGLLVLKEGQARPDLPASLDRWDLLDHQDLRDRAIVLALMIWRAPVLGFFTAHLVSEDQKEYRVPLECQVFRVRVVYLV